MAFITREIEEFHDALASDARQQALIAHAVSVGDTNLITAQYGYRTDEGGLAAGLPGLLETVAKVAPVVAAAVVGPEGSAAVAGLQAGISVARGNYLGGALALTGAVDPLGLGGKVGFLDDIGSVIQGGADTVAGWFAPPDSADPHTSLDDLGSTLYDFATKTAPDFAAWSTAHPGGTPLFGSAPTGVPSSGPARAAVRSPLPGSPSLLPGSGQDKGEQGAGGGAAGGSSWWLQPFGWVGALAQKFQSPHATGGTDMLGVPAFNSGYSTVPQLDQSQVDAYQGENYGATGGTTSMAGCGCPMPTNSIAKVRSAAMCALSQKLGFRINARSLAALMRLMGPAFLVIAQALGLDASSLLLLFMGGRRHRRGRGISARDIRTTKRTARAFHSLQHQLAGLGTRRSYPRGGNVIPFRRRRRRAA